MGDDSNNDSATDLPLGKWVSYPEQYDPTLLRSIPRRLSRQSLGIADDSLPFVGVDIWNAYELSWLDAAGKPVVAQAEFRFPADTPVIIESKSFKLYLNSLNQTRIADHRTLEEILRRDLSAAAGSVDVSLDAPHLGRVASLSGDCLDGQEIECDDYRLNPDGLKAGGEVVEEQLYSHLLRSLCPVTGQPDWGSVVIVYRGPAIDRDGLLRYIIGYRQHQEFHEQCVERIFMDLQSRCRPEQLLVYARYVRRGGLDINPYRSSEPRDYPNLRLRRQ